MCSGIRLLVAGGGAAVTAAARAAAAAVLVGGGLFAEDARLREEGGSLGLVVGVCFACCKQVQGISANAFSVVGLRSQHNSRPGCFRERAFRPVRRLA